MRATRYGGAYDITVVERPDPAVEQPTDAVVRVLLGCVCGSDLWYFRGISPHADGPIGHEFIGIVEQTGSQVAAVTEGDLVIAPFLWCCGRCRPCQTGWPSNCVNGDSFGNHGHDGGQGELVHVPYADATLVTVPAGNYDDATMKSLLALSDVACTGHHAAVSARVRPGQSVAVVGDGAVGLSAVLAAHRLGAGRVIALSRNPARQRVAVKFGATDLVAERGEDAVAHVLELTGGYGADAVMECVGTGQSVDTAFGIAAVGAMVGAVGVPHEVILPVTTMISATPDLPAASRRPGSTSPNCCPMCSPAPSTRAWCSTTRPTSTTSWTRTRPWTNAGRSSRPSASAGDQVATPAPPGPLGSDHRPRAAARPSANRRSTLAVLVAASVGLASLVTACQSPAEPPALREPASSSGPAASPTPSAGPLVRTVEVTETTPLSAILEAAEFEGFGGLLFPNRGRITANMTVSDTAGLLPYHSNIDPAEVTRTLTELQQGVLDGQVTFHPVYDADEVAADPAKAEVGLFFFRGTPNAAFAIVSPGGGFAYVGSIHEGFPYAQRINQHGYNAFVLNYRTGDGGRPATEDLARSIDYVFDNQSALQVSTEGYSLWGSSAGARMAANLGSYGPATFGAAEHPRPGTVVMAYTGHSDFAENEPATFAVVGSVDGIASPTVMRQRIERLAQAGAPTEFHLFDGIGHGFGLGTGTVAEGWADDAVRFWEQQLEAD